MVKEVSRNFFQRVFDKMNLAIFHPKRDQCDVCVGYETKNVSEEDYTLHRKRGEDARAAKERDKQTALGTNTVKMITMDLQSALLCPKMEASAMYYKTKLACHKFTVYNLATESVKFYFWHEGEGGLTANSFASCLDNYITDTVGEDTSEVILYSDGCGYQSRNATLANMFLRRAVINNLTITQNYLEKGHTQMEVDSVHSTIERAIKGRPIYSPSNYVELLKKACSKQPYDVLYKDHAFFDDFTSLKYYDTIRPGNRVGVPVVTDIRSIQYLPDGTIKYKLSFDEEYKDLPQRRNWRKPVRGDTVLPLYQQSIPIKNAKFEHLQQLKAVIPKDYHPLYMPLNLITYFKYKIIKWSRIV